MTTYTLQLKPTTIVANTPSNITSTSIKKSGQSIPFNVALTFDYSPYILSSLSEILMTEDSQYLEVE